MEKLKLTCYGGVGSVTGANFMLEGPECRLLVDCGLVQGSKAADAENRKDFGYDPSTVNFLFITHAHIDHIGRIAKLVKDGFKGTIYSHPATRDLSDVMMPDAYSLMVGASRSQGLEPYYSEDDIRTAQSLWKTIEYGTPEEIGGFSVTLRDAGHVLGSAMYEFERNGKKILFTGDLGNSPSLLLRDTDPIKGIDYMVMESVYGDRNHEAREERTEKLAESIRETIARKGTLVIPAFSLERSQMIIYEINNLIEDKKVPSVPVFVDSPLATKVTDIYRRYTHLFNPGVLKEISGGDDIFDFPKLSFTVRPAESKAIERTPDPKIIVAGSGMSVGGRVLSHELEHLSDPKSMVLLVGFQPLGTLGRELLDGAKRVTISGQHVDVHAKVDIIRAYSSHKDSDHLLEFVEGSAETLKKVFVAMGEPKSSLFLSQRIRDFLGVDAIYPERGKTYELGL